MKAKFTSLNYYLKPEYFLVLFVLYSFVGTTPFSIGVDEFDPTEGDASLLRRFVYFGFLIVSYLFFLKSKFNARLLTVLFWPYFAFALFISLSTLWSVEPLVTFVRSTLYLISVFTLVFFVCSINVDFFISRLTKLFLILLILSFSSVFIIPTAVHSIPELAGNWRGIFSHKNDAGLAMVFSIILFLCAYMKSGRNIWVFSIFLSLIFLYFTASKTSMGFLFACLFFGFLYSRLSFYFSAFSIYNSFLILFFILSSVFFFMTSFDFFDFLDEVLYDPESFTGRSLIWDYLLNLVYDRPILGYGYGAIWGMGEDSSLYNYSTQYNIWIYTLSQGHNSYLDLVLSVGIVGLFFFMFLYVFTHLVFVKRNSLLSREFNFIFYSVWSFFLLHGLMESNFLLVDKGRWTLFHILVLIKVRLLFEGNRVPVSDR